MKKNYRINGLNCAVCAGEIEKAINGLDEVENASLNFASLKLTVNYKSDTDVNRAYLKIIETINRIEDGVTVVSNNEKNAVASRKLIFNVSNFFIILGIFLFLAAVIIEFAVLGGHDHVGYEFLWDHIAEGMTALQIVSYVFYYIAFLFCGHKVLYKFFKRIKNLKFLDENFLMIIVGIGAFILTENLEAVSILIFYQIGEFFQELALDRSRNSIKALASLKADIVNKYVDGSIKNVDAEDINIGDDILVKAGERIALDSVISKGETSLDVSHITGENLPKFVKKGDYIHSGSLNLENVFIANVKKQYSDSTVSKIIETIESVAEKKAKSEQFITKFSKIYTPVVVALALIIAIFVPAVTGEPFAKWIYVGLTFLIVSCPCGLVLSIPMSFYGGIGAASKHGILFKGGNYLEEINKANTLILDKTGTLTYGVHEIKKINPADDVTSDYLLKTTAYSESLSTHPIAKSIVRHYDKEINYQTISDYKEKSGHGIEAVIDGKKVFCGSYNFIKKSGAAIEENKSGGTVIYLAENGKYLGNIEVGDKIKIDAEETVNELYSLGVKRTIILTGDKKQEAETIAKEANISEVYSGLLPEQKLEFLDSIISGQKKDERTVYVGEGINDVPSIVRADIGIAMGALGSDAAIEAADVVIMTDELSKIPLAMRIARKTKQIVFANIIVIIFIKILIMLLGLILEAQNITIPYYILLAEFADVGIALAAVLYATSIIRFNPKKKHKHKT